MKSLAVTSGLHLIPPWCKEARADPRKRVMTMKPFVAFLVIVFAGAPAVVAQSDTLPPQLVAVSFAPSSVDVTLSVQTVPFMAHVTDNLSGVDGVTVTLRSPSGIQTPL